MHPAYLETRFKVPEAVSSWPGQFAIVTAHATTGERWSADRNAEADERLEAEIRKMGCWHRRITGYSPSTGHAEPGWAVEMGVDEARDLGRRYLQDAVFHVRGDGLSVVKCAPGERRAFVGPFRQRFENADGSTGGICPEPLILGGWSLTRDWEKARRWHETLKWAHRHGLEDKIALREGDFYHWSGRAPPSDDVAERHP